LSPESIPYIDSHGSLLVRLKRALYSCVQSSKLWYDKLCQVLVQDGFVCNEYDRCVFNRIDGVTGHQITVCSHVDDLLITCKSASAIDSLESYLKTKFNEVTFVRGKKHKYLSINLSEENDNWRIDIHTYISKCIEGKDCNNGATSPALGDLFDESEDSLKLDDDDAKKIFHTDIARLLYLAKRAGMDILTAVSHLCSRVCEPTEEDQKKINRIFMYLFTTRDIVMKLKIGCDVELKTYIDASFGIHADGSSRTGVVLYMSGVGIAAWTSKQKLVTKSSTKSEIVGLSDGGYKDIGPTVGVSGQQRCVDIDDE
jgi:hypothetical protein